MPETGFAVLDRRMRELASRDPRGLGRVPSQAPLRRRLERARQALQRLSRDLESPPPAVCWFLDNYPLLEETALLPPPRVRLPLLAGSQLRALQLSHIAVEQFDGHVDEQALQLVLEGFLALRPLSMDELWAIPDLLRLSLVEACARLGEEQAEQLNLEREAVQAARTALRAGRDLRALAPRHYTAAGVAAIHGLLQEQGGGEALSDALRSNGLELKPLLAAYRESRALGEYQMSGLVDSLRRLGELNYADLFEALCPVERLLRREPSGVYGLSDFETRDLLRRRLGRVARGHGLGEVETAEKLLLLCKAGTGLKEQQPGYYLLEVEGLRKLSAVLGGAGAGFNARLFLHAHSRGAFFGLYALLAAGAAGLLLWLAGPLAAALALLPALGLAGRLAGALLRPCFPPRVLCKLDFSSALAPDAGTAVCIPALLSSPERIRAAAFNLEKAYLANPQEGLRFVLLGDFADHDQPEREDDRDILRAGQEAVRALNLRYGERFFYLHRPRSYSLTQEQYLGWERKRGALKQFNQAVLSGSDQDFLCCVPSLEGLEGVRYVLTLDADTYLPPNAAAKLAGAAAHPLNRDHGVLAPRAQSLYFHGQSLFSRLFSAGGGVDSYVTAVSETYQDLFGEGIFGGKGIYNLRAFEQATEHLPQNAILSHDCLEGLLAKAALVSDVCVYERQPQTLRAWAARQHRWVRGDWQLLPFVFQRGFRGLDRFKLLDNLRRSLSPLFAVLAAVLCGPAGLLPLLFELGLPRDPAWPLRLALLPWQAVLQLDAACTSLWRMAVTRKGLLSWVTSADVGERGELRPLRLWACPLAGALSLSPLLLPLWGLAPLLCLYLPRPGFPRESLTQEDRAFLLEMARRSYRFFEETLRPEDRFLPPDNLQEQPGPKLARRTSPTNIGLSLLAHAAAHSLGLIDAPLMARRMEQTLASLEALETWKGHPYNWYSTEDGSVLPPRYVSSVDNGNLGCCLWAAAARLRAVGEMGLADRCDALVRRMDFSLLYDPERSLFHIGFDQGRGEASAGHYDLLASESLLLSFLAVAKGDVPLRHFRALSRPLCRQGRQIALLSWSGTLFEYLMPLLLLTPAPGSLLDRSAQGAVFAQMAAAGGERPFGESESGRYAFDLNLNYQYKAFGLPSLSMRGAGGEEVVVAPYAAALALLVRPRAAAENLRAMEALGWADGHGFFEAADYTQPGADGLGRPYALVQSHMAHHQGMALLAMEAALKGGIREAFASLPAVAAYEWLLQERAPAGKPPERRRPARPRENTPYQPPKTAYSLSAGELGGQLLGGGNCCLQLLNHGVSLCLHRGDALYRADPGEEGLLFYLNGRRVVFARMRHEAGVCTLQGEASGLGLRLELALSPEDGALGLRAEVQGLEDGQEALLCVYCEPLLARPEEAAAHPAFLSLFLQAEALEGEGLWLRRRSRDGSTPKELRFLLFGDGAFAGAQSSRLRFLGRGRDLWHPQLQLDEPEALQRTPLYPCAALARRFRGKDGRVQGCCGLLSPAPLSPSPALQLERLFGYAKIRAQAEAHAYGLGPRFLRAANRALGCLLRPDRVGGARAQAAWDSTLPLCALWRFGLSGEKPLISVWVQDASQLPLARQAVKLHAYLYDMGLPVELCLVDMGPADYHQSLLRQLQALAHRGVALQQSALSPEERLLLRSRSALLLEGEADLEAQLPRLRHAPPAAPPPRQAAPAALALADESLHDACPYGGFSQDGRRYLILKTPPLPWSHVLANPRFGSLVTERFGGYSFYQNARLFRLTPFSNDPVEDPRGEGVFLLDEYGGEPDFLCDRVQYGQGFAVGESGALGLYARQTQAVDPKLPVKLLHLRLHNPSAAVRSLHVYAFARWVLGEDVRLNAMGILTWRKGRALLARNALGGALGFLALLDELPFSYSCDGEELAQALAGRPRLSCRQGCGMEPCALLEVPLRLEPGQTRTLCFALGAAGDEAEALALLEGLDPQALFRRTEAYWDDLLSRIRLDTPNERLNRLCNFWLPYQVLSARLYGRTGFYQSGGAYGFRDQLQDAAMLAFYDPAFLREQLLLCAAHQFEEGDVQHWWHPERRGVRTRISDDLLFLPWAAAQYLRRTGDTGLLAVEVPFLRGPELEPGQEDRYFEPETGESASLLEHCLRALRRSSRLGPHGLPLMGGGDWNDAMNRVGLDGPGESVLTAWFLCLCLRDFLPYVPAAQRPALERLGAEVAAALEANAYDGNWYLRAFFGDGVPLGGEAAEECRIDLTAQVLAVLSGAARPDRARRALDAAMERLYLPGLRMLKLLDPPFDGHGPNPGYIAGYVPGVRENGGQYTHAAAWAALALCRLDDPRGAQLLLQLLPTGRDPERYMVEPYVAAADIYAGEHPGRGGWTWYTGSAGWLWRAAVEGVLGLRVEDGRLCLRPCPPEDWEGFSLRYHGRELRWSAAGRQEDPTGQQP